MDKLDEISILHGQQKSAGIRKRSHIPENGGNEADEGNEELVRGKVGGDEVL